MNIVEVVLAKQIFAPRDERCQNFDHVESRRVLLRLCAFLPILAATFIALEITGRGESGSPIRQRTTSSAEFRAW
ncbi:hypothetical protein M1D34_28785 (plasmid) [Ensifer sp. D2-11]